MPRKTLGRGGGVGGGPAPPYVTPVGNFCIPRSPNRLGTAHQPPHSLPPGRWRGNGPLPFRVERTPFKTVCLLRARRSLERGGESPEEARAFPLRSGARSPPWHHPRPNMDFVFVRSPEQPPAETELPECPPVYFNLPAPQPWRLACLPEGDPR